MEGKDSASRTITLNFGLDGSFWIAELSLTYQKTGQTPEPFDIDILQFPEKPVATVFHAVRDTDPQVPLRLFFDARFDRRDPKFPRLVLVRRVVEHNRTTIYVEPAP